MEELIRRRQKLEEDLKIIQNDIYQSEQVYLQETWNSGGNVVKGFDGYLSNKVNRIKSSSSSSSSASVGSSSTTSTYKIKEKDRIFSDSSKFLKFDKNGRKEIDSSSCLSYGRIEFVDESSLIWDPVPIIVSTASSSLTTVVNSHPQVEDSQSNEQQQKQLSNGSGSGVDRIMDHQLMPPPKQGRNQPFNK